MAITLRREKGSALTYDELDNNFLEVRDLTGQASDSASSAKSSEGVSTQNAEQTSQDVATAAASADSATESADRAEAAYEEVIYSTGFQPSPTGSVFQIGASVANSQQTLSYDGEQYRTDGAGTVTQATPETDPLPWYNVTLQDRKAVARSLNVKDLQVIYHNDTVTALDDIWYIYDSTANQVAWHKPADLPAGAQIEAVIGDQLTYSPGSVTVTLSKAIINYAFLNVADMQSAKPIWGEDGTAHFQVPQRMTTGGMTWETGVAGTIDLGGGIFASPLEYGNVKDYVGSATGDVSALVQRAFDDNKAVYFPSGNYTFIGVVLSKTHQVFGDGANASILRPASAGTMFTITNGDSTTFDNLRFKHDRSLNVDGIEYSALNNRWNHMNNVYFEGLKGSAIHVTTIILETVFSALKISKCGDPGKPAMWFQNPITSNDATNNMSITDLALYAPQGIGIKFESEHDSSPLPGSKTIRIVDCLLHGGTAEGATTPPYPADLLVFDGCSDTLITGNSFRQIAEGHRGIVIGSPLTTRNRGGVIENNIFASTDSNWKGVAVDNTQELEIGYNRFADSGCVEHILVGSDCNRVRLGRQSGYVGGDVVIVNNGSNTKGYVNNREFSFDYQGAVAISGIKGINGSLNISGSVTITSGTTADVVFANVEPNSGYRLIFSPSNDVRVWRTNKSSTGFTINISSAVSVVIDWFIVR